MKINQQFYPPKNSWRYCKEEQEYEFGVTQSELSRYEPKWILYAHTPMTHELCVFLWSWQKLSFFFYIKNLWKEAYDVCVISWKIITFIKKTLIFVKIIWLMTKINFPVSYVLSFRESVHSSIKLSAVYQLFPPQCFQTRLSGSLQRDCPY